MASPSRRPAFSATIAFARRWIGPILLVYWLALFVSTHIPVPADLLRAPGSDKIAHFLAYAGLALLFGLWVRRTPWGSQLHPLAAFLALAAWAALDELLQIPVNRTADPLDWVADAAGILVGLAVAGLIRSMLSR